MELNKKILINLDNGIIILIYKNLIYNLSKKL